MKKYLASVHVYGMGDYIGTSDDDFESAIEAAEDLYQGWDGGVFIYLYQVEGTRVVSIIGYVPTEEDKVRVVQRRLRRGW